MTISPQPKPHVKENTASKGSSISAVNKRLDFELVKNTSNLQTFRFAQQPPNMPSGIPYREGYKVPKGSETPKIINLTSAGLGRYYRLTNKPKQKYGLFARLSLAGVGLCDMDKNPHIFITRENQHIQIINGHFDIALNHFGPLVFAENQEQNESYTFRKILLQPDKSYFILSIIKEVESHGSINHGTLTKNSEVNNKRKNKDYNIKNILSILYLNCRILSYRIFDSCT